MTSPSEPTTYVQFFQQVMQGLGVTNNQTAAESALAAVSHFEGANDYFNPLNVVQKEPGSSNFNSVGVQRYPDAATGVKGTIDLFKNNPIWNNVIATMKTGSESDILRAFDQVYQTWGSSGPVPIPDAQAAAILESPLKGGKFNTKPGQSLPGSPSSKTTTSYNIFGLDVTSIINFFTGLAWIFNINHFIKFMLYVGGAVLAITGFAMIVFGAGHNEGEAA